MKMTEQEALRRKILLRILAATIAVFVITGIVYIVTIARYIGPNTDENIKVQEAEVAVETDAPPAMTEVSAADTTVEEPAEEIASEPEDTTETENVTVADAETPADVTIPDNFHDKIVMNYSDEMDAADSVYFTDTTYVAVTKSYIRDEPYWLFHVMVDDPSQITTSIVENPANRKSAFVMNQSKPYVLAIPGSDMVSGYMQLKDGVHVYNGGLYGNRTETLGTEVLFTKVGYMSKADSGVSYEDLNQPELSWSISVACPTLIDNGVSLDIPESAASNRSCKIAMGMVSPCDYYFLACSDGDYICDVTYEEMQTILAEKYCFFAQALHTEANAFIAMDGKIINDPAVQYGRPQLEYIVITDDPN